MIIKTKKGEAMIPSPFEIHAYAIPLPPLKDEFLLDAIRLGLRSVHPGDPALSDIDYELADIRAGHSGEFRSKGGTVIAYTVRTSELDSLRRLPIALIPGVAIIKESLRRDRTESVESSQPEFVVLEADDWIQAATILDGAISEIVSYAAPRSAQEAETLIAQLIDKRKGPKSFVHISFDANRPFSLSPHASRHIDANEIAKGMNPAKHAIYAPRQNESPRFHKAIIVALVAANLFAVYTYANRIASTYEKRAASLKAEYETRKRDSVHAVELQQSIEAIRRRANATAPGSVADPYAILQAIHAALGDGWILGFAVDPDTFKLDAEGSDSLDVVSSLESSRLFSEVRLRQSSPSKIKRETFTITGRLAK